MVRPLWQSRRHASTAGPEQRKAACGLIESKLRGIPGGAAPPLVKPNAILASLELSLHIVPGDSASTLILEAEYRSDRWRRPSLSTTFFNRRRRLFTRRNSRRPRHCSPP